MDAFMLLGTMAARQTADVLQQRNAVTERFGLSLSPAQSLRLGVRYAEILRETERVGLDEGILPELAIALCDSPYVRQETWEDTLGELAELFYRFKGACGERLTDAALLAALTALYNGYAGGCAEQIAALDGRAMLRYAHTGEVEENA